MKRVLIITYYWPPAGGPGVQRWLHFVRYFKEFGIEPTVFIPANPTYPIQDEELKDLVPEDIQIIKHPIKEPYALAKKLSSKKTKTLSKGIISSESPGSIERLLLYIRGNLFIPDARAGWVKPSVKRLSQELDQQQYDAIVTTGPPHSLHLIGLHLKKQFKIPWLADFRDPWTNIHYHKNLLLSKRAETRHKLLEKQVLRQADAVVATSKHTASEFEDISGREVAVVTNGFEPVTTLEEKSSNKFVLSHLGTLLSDRNPVLLWSAIGELIKEDPVFAASFSLELYGSVSEEVMKAIVEFIPSDLVKDHGYVSHRQVLIAQRKASVLLLIEMDRPETVGIIPGKLFEYLSAERPIIAVGPRGSEIADILTHTNAGNYFGYSDRDGIKKTLRRYFDDYKSGSVESQIRNLKDFTRRNLTGKMSGIIDLMISETPD